MPAKPPTGATAPMSVANRPMSATAPMVAANRPMSVANRLKWAAVGWTTGAVISALVLVWAMAGTTGGEADSATGRSRGADASPVSEADSTHTGTTDSATDSTHTDTTDSATDSTHTDTTDLQIGWMFAAQWPLWLGMLGAALLARRHGLQWREQLGWQWRIIDIPVGVAVGIAMQLLAVPLLYMPIFWVSQTLDWKVFEDLGFQNLAEEDVELQARELIDKAHTPLAVAALVVMAVMMAPLAEEVFFRGLLQGALQDRFSPFTAVGGASLIFALVHLQPLQFPALLMVGVVHGLMLRYSKRLTAALCSHMAFNATTVVILL